MGKTKENNISLEIEVKTLKERKNVTRVTWGHRIFRGLLFVYVYASCNTKLLWVCVSEM